MSIILALRFSGIHVSGAFFGVCFSRMVSGSDWRMCSEAGSTYINVSLAAGDHNNARLTVTVTHVVTAWATVNMTRWTVLGTFACTVCENIVTVEGLFDVCVVTWATASLFALSRNLKTQTSEESPALSKILWCHNNNNNNNDNKLLYCSYTHIARTCTLHNTTSFATQALAQLNRIPGVSIH